MNPDELAQQAEGWLQVARPWLPTVGIALGVLFVLLIVVRMVRRFGRKSTKTSQETASAAAAQRLPTTGPPAGGPQLTLLSIPMRLAVVVVAPVGRIGEVPSESNLPGLLEQVVPGLARVMASHRPLVQTMGPQLSSKGFAHTVFGKLKLPGVHAAGDTDAQGKGTPWSMIAGKIDVDGHKLQIAMVLRADKQNAVGGVILEHAAQWLEMVKIQAKN